MIVGPVSKGLGHTVSQDDATVKSCSGTCEEATWADQSMQGVVSWRVLGEHE